MTDEPDRTDDNESQDAPADDASTDEIPPPPPSPPGADTVTAPTVDRAGDEPPGARDVVDDAVDVGEPDAMEIPPPPGAEALEEKPGPWARFTAAYRRSSKPLLYGSAAVVLLLGLAIGGAAGMTSANEEKERADDLQKELDDANDEAAAARGDADKAAEDAAADVEAARKDADDQIAAAQGELDDRQADLDQQAADLDKRSGDLDARENEIAGAEAAAEANSFGDGLHVVGTDIQPGTYKTDGGQFCYWERLSGLSGEFGDIITNDIGEGPKTVSIAASDAAFSSDGCGTWNKIG